MAIERLNWLLPNDYAKIVPGKIIYSPMLNEDGGVIDDLLVMSITDTLYHIVVNFTNIQKDYDWIKEKLTSNDIKVENRSDKLSIIAIQGPNALNFIEKELKIPVSELKPFTVKLFQYNCKEVTVSRTGYTGEDGFELIIENSEVVNLFTDILSKGKDYNLLPCGLGCRDTLRLEAGLPLYGQELNDS